MSNLDEISSSLHNLVLVQTPSVKWG